MTNAPEHKPAARDKNSQPASESSTITNAESTSTAQPSPSSNEREVRRELARRTRRGFLIGGASIVGGVLGFRWLTSTDTSFQGLTIPGSAMEDRASWPLRRVFRVNESLWQPIVRPSNLAREFPSSKARRLRVNGRHGISEVVDGRRRFTEVDVDAWRLRVEGPNEGAQPKLLNLDQIKALPAVTHTTEFKCVEGWSTIATWTGVRLIDLARMTGLATRSGKPFEETGPDDLARYVAMETPDGTYYVGLDIASALHPQTLLAYELNGRPLTPGHGAPIRLVIPIKYGIKNIKRIGLIHFTDERPRDYWAERGYDWFASL